MAYTIQALIGRKPVLERAASGLRRAQIVPLKGELALLSFSDELREEIEGVQAGPVRKGFYCLTAPIVALAEWASELGPVAYVEAEFFGGRGTQTALLWNDASVVLGPLRATDEDDEVEPGTAVGMPLSEWPINRVLRELGVRVAEGKDEFDTVGLGHHRD